MTFPRRASRPDLPGDELARCAAFPKPQFTSADNPPVDTRGLGHPKLHPDRDPAYRRWLRLQPCVIKGKRDHVCWSRTRCSGQPLSDSAHTGKAFSGRLKQSDSNCIPLCRLAHEEQERGMDAFDQKYGLDRFDVAREHNERYRRGKGLQ